MTKDEALKQIIDLIQPVAALADGTPFEHSEVIQRCVDAVEIALEAMAQPEQEPVDCYGYAARLATSIWKQHYQKTAPQWQVLDDLIGVLTQIDNMAAGLISTPLPVQPEQEPVAWEQFYEHFVERNFCPRCGKRTVDLTTIHTCTPPQGNT